MELTAEITSDAFPAFCREHGLKCTAQRLAVFNAVRLSRRHLSDWTCPLCCVGKDQFEPL